MSGLIILWIVCFLFVVYQVAAGFGCKWVDQVEFRIKQIFGRLVMIGLGLFCVWLAAIYFASEVGAFDL